MKTNGMVSDQLAVGIEIGGTKLQVGIGSADGKLLKPPMRRTVVRERGAQGILLDITSMIQDLLNSSGCALSEICKIGIGFGGPLDSKRGVVLKSYQIGGWDGFPLRQWAEDQWGKPVLVENDASTAGLAEALHGSGRGCSRVFYMTIGSGIGGGWIVDRKIDYGQGLGSAEMGHTWIPDPDTGAPAELEHVCSCWGIGRRARLVAVEESLMLTLAGSREAIDARIVYAAAEQGDELANRILHETCEGLGVAISNVVALLHPERVVIGGGVSLMGQLFWDLLRAEVTNRAMPLFMSSVEVVKAELGEDVVVVGALCL
jgi:glucokinase